MKDKPKSFLVRGLEILPGTLTWVTLLGSPILSYFYPGAVAIYIILFDLYWLLKGANVAIHLMHSYHTLRVHNGVDWLDWLNRLWTSREDFVNHLKHEYGGAQKMLTRNLYESSLERMNKLPLDRNFDWKRIYHLILLPTVSEDFEVLDQSIGSCANADYPSDKMIFVLSYEERGGEVAVQNAQRLQEKYHNKFYKFLSVQHPDGLEGEAKVKGANITFGAKTALKLIEELGIPLEDIVVSGFDSDTTVSKNYFAHLTFNFITALKPHRTSYQPLPMFHNNIWDTPAIARVIAISSSFWQLVEASRPDRLITFSSHAMSFKTLVDVDFWRVDIIPDDSHIFWQCFLHFDGDYRTEPLFTTVSMDAVLGDTYFETMLAQYKQKRRWAWGVTEISMVIPEFLRNKKIALWKRLLYGERLFEQHYFWATASVMIAILGWMPLILGGDRFDNSVLALNLPVMTKVIMSVATVFLIFSIYVNMVLLPPRPKGYSAWKTLSMVTQWVFAPIVSSLFGSMPAIDAQTRLMFRRYMEFFVTPKRRRANVSEEIPPDAIIKEAK